MVVDKASEESEDELTLSIVKAEKKPVPATVGGKTDQPEEGVDDGGALDQPAVEPPPADE